MTINGASHPLCFGIFILSLNPTAIYKVDSTIFYSQETASKRLDDFSELTEVAGDIVTNDFHVISVFCATLASLLASLRNQELKSAVAELSVRETRK